MCGIIFLDLKKTSYNSSFRWYTCVSSYFWPRVNDRELTGVNPSVQTYKNSLISSWWLPNKLVRDLAPECRHCSCQSKTQSLGTIKRIPQSQWMVFSEGVAVGATIHIYAENLLKWVHHWIRRLPSWRLSFTIGKVGSCSRLYYPFSVRFFR